MRVHHLTMTAFGPYAGTEHVDFDALTDSGLFLLHGDTGAGKTSILDAVCFALYGGVPGLRPTLKLRSDHAPADLRTEVVLDFTVAGRRLKITRRPQQTYPSTRARDKIATAPASVQLAEYRTSSGTDSGAAWHSVCAGHQDVANEIDTVLGLNKTQFCQVVLLPQGAFAEFLHSSDKDRRVLLSKLFGTERFQSLQTWLTNQSRTAKASLDESVQVVERLGDRIEQSARPITAPSDPQAAEALLPARAEPHNTHDTLAWAQALLAQAASVRNRANAADEHAGHEHRHRKDELQQAQELAGRQSQYRAALDEKHTLDEQATNHPQLTLRLHQGRRAGQLSPLLDDLEATRQRLEQAQRDQDKARTFLAAELADAELPRLEAALAEHHTDIGHLNALLPQEVQQVELAELITELTGKEEEARQERDDAQQWLDQWPPLEREHTDQIADLLKAAADLPHLSEAVSAAKQKRDKAQERDRLQTQLADAEHTATQLKEAAQLARTHWLDLREQRLDGMAGELAADLRDGVPCTVCGSPVHPAPAAKQPGQPDRADEDNARIQFDQADAAAVTADLRCNQLNTAHAKAEGEAGSATPEQIEADLDQAEAAYQHARAQEDKLVPLQQTLEALQTEQTRRSTTHAKAHEQVIECQGRLATLSQEHGRITRTLETAKGTAPSLDDKIAQLTQAADHIAAAINATREAATAAERHHKAEHTATSAATKADFSSIEEAAAALQPTADLAAWEEELKQWDRENAAVTRTLKTPILADAHAQPPADLTAAEAAVNAAETQLKATAAALGQAKDCATQLEDLTAKIEQALAKLHPRHEAYLLADRLAGIASATSAANTRDMELEAYVLAARLEQIADEANNRLKTMLPRYTLLHTTSRDTGQRGGRTKLGLGLRVMDNWTGADRETSTLSGGETFIVSLALALALAEVVTQEAGGRTLDTLFIDEGFGTLDENALQNVLDVLDQLRAGARTVGVISHVADLRDRIPAQLRVIKKENGSTLRETATT
ncbi:AAA family ATPase [Streptacidiphilus fuscans]|uniref:Nuclease SbcCD subunit C n=1 Tax=Streptacidiphilus fuscans TaxID=2789292 RepID=A0A931FJF1_9ACTN|nr:SMC family ATPase [Streptacidiphilus fuscans]MBF9073911.1 SMC family ATPase [Streptacidiphilus fuscans]